MNVVGVRTTVGKNRKRPRKDDLKDNTAQPVRRSTRLIWKDKSKKQKEEKGDSSESVVHHPSVTVKKEENKGHYMILMEEEKEMEEKKVVRKRYTNCSRLYNSNGCLRPDPDAPMSESSFSMDSNTSSDSSINKRELAYLKKIREALEAPGAYAVYEHENAEERTIREEKEENEKLRMIEYYRSEIEKIKRDRMVPVPSSDSSLSSSSCDVDESPIPNQAEFLKGMARQQAIAIAKAEAKAKRAKVKFPLKSEEDSDDDSSESDGIKSEKEKSELDSSFSSLDSDESSDGAMDVDVDADVDVDDDDDSVTYTMKKTFKNIPVRLTYEPSDEEKLCREAAYPHTGYRCSKQTGYYTSTEMNLGLQLWDRW